MLLQLLNYYFNIAIHALIFVTCLAAGKQYKSLNVIIINY